MRAGRGGIRCDQGGSSCEPGVVCDTSRPGCYLMRTVWGGIRCEPPGEVSDASRLGWYLMPAVRVARSRQEPPWKRARTRQEPPGAARSHLEPPEAGHTTPQEPKKGGRKNRAPLGRELLEKGCRFLGTRSGALCEEKGAPRGLVSGRAAAFFGGTLLGPPLAPAVRFPGPESEPPFWRSFSPPGPTGGASTPPTPRHSPGASREVSDAIRPGWFRLRKRFFSGSRCGNRNAEVFSQLSKELSRF